ncbi:MAG TPA: tagatose 1,6-diphosphate aldolase [Chloroflexota bacterium]|nr:tagatose 1,6-diphosphate aldolase [Chloroflexota bacterium]
MTLTQGKINGLQALADPRGVFADLAMDQRGSLKKALQAAGLQNVTDHDMETFKLDVTEVLSPIASGILLDPEYGLPASQHRAASCGLLLAYEKSGYDNTQPGRLPDLLPHESVYRIKQQGANAVKVLLYYNPDEKEDVNDVKHAFTERIGNECRGADIPFFLEFVGYPLDGEDEKGLEYAKKKPRIVLESIREFSKEQYYVDVLKVEVPVNMKFVSGTNAFAGEAAYSREEAIQYFREQAQAAGKPFIYLSAGVSNEEFTETLRLAGDSGVRFNGVLCGRAAWKDGVPAYAQKGSDGFRAWLQTQGAHNLKNVFDTLQAAQPWYEFYGASSPQGVLADTTVTQQATAMASS